MPKAPGNGLFCHLSAEPDSTNACIHLADTIPGKWYLSGDTCVLLAFLIEENRNKLSEIHR